ncbi:PREDICTED: stromal cell-derived factor 1, partial [Phaethon lepturus]|uniref:stromal cell-derived factor 1 n=2 Tax=Neoaves TaxID=3078114 RepID=UPI000530A92F
LGVQKDCRSLLRNLSVIRHPGVAPRCGGPGWDEGLAAVGDGQPLGPGKACKTRGFSAATRGSNVSFLSLCPAEKPVSLTYRCPCRFYESNVARANIKHLKILSTPNCSLQIVARLKSNSKQVCIDPKLKWIQEYLEKALNKPRHRTHKKKQQKKRGPLCPSRATPLKSPGRKNGGSRCKRQAL